MGRRGRGGFTLVELLVVIVIIALLAALLLPALVKALCSGKQGGAQHLIDNLSQATDMYYNDQATYPPGGGAGSATLVNALKTFGAKKQQYFEFRPGDTDTAGNIISPIRPGIDVLNYKNNRVNWPGNQGDANAHNKQRFDIWCADCNNITNGCNNWGGN